ncbi:hypothetical protein A7A78_01550 [Aequorivita soesokkakensis]|uniref:TonB-dependent receptor plug domain-containing protein n=1 Tax=Aequorivita soesokkakensis TaxID=1385699 RepID=A0A1A9LIR4_9FLAO|nr:TonB-dependent receptor plug domain-containing protein [Aequorivita soesokkakensis]OAD92621.1 hypothetical protein A7A78_01550 [Aequorivita soesokkakensis]
MKNKLVLIILTLSCLAFTFVDTSGLKILILNRLNEYTAEKYPEKIYIQTDKPYYTAGENIWFNAYLVNGVTHTKTNKSKVVYVELINEQDSIISDRRLYTDSINAPGDFKLPIDLKGGSYLLRAYTNYMRNQSNDFFFKKQIQIFAFNSGVNTDDFSDSSKIKESSASPDLGFYPEGGYLVSGINNKVAVKIKDADLNASPVIGYIEDSQGNKITDFKTMEFGLAYFNLNPEKGKEYRAIVNSGNEDIVFPLPDPLKDGYVMNTSSTEKDVVIKVTTNKPQGLKNTLLIGHQRGLAAFDYTQEKDLSSMLLKIPKENLIEGVLDIVFFNQSEQPVAERLLYIKKEEKELSVSVKKKTNAPISVRERVNLEIEVKDKFGKLIPSNLSLSVIDTELIKPNENAENIKTWLLLNSDLRGKIKSPNYFFQNGDNIKKKELLDLIMMTHGWRRFTWQEFSKNSMFQEFQPEDGIYINGITISANTPFKSKFSETKLTFRKDGFIQETQNTDENGSFSYGPYIFKDEIGVLLQAGEGLSSNNANYSDTNIKLAPPLEKPEISPQSKNVAFIQKNPSVEAYKQKAKKIVVTNFKFDKDREILDEVNIKTTRISKEELNEIERNKRTKHFTPSYRIIVDDMGMHGGADFMELIANVPGIRIGKTYKAETSQDVVVNLRGMEPRYFVDGIQVTLNDARSIPQANIDFIDIRNVGHASANYAFAAQGVIAIYTKQGRRGGGASKIINRKAGSISFQLDGFYNSREFYAPDYSFEDRNSAREDRRTTLYWNPKIRIEENANATISFYSSDDKGNFQIDIEGITDTGIPIHATAMLTVE